MKVVPIAINTTKFKKTQETNKTSLWVCLWWDFQGWVTKEGEMYPYQE